jgi:hypothetical protein
LNNGVTVIVDQVNKVVEGLRLLAVTRVMVGIPAEKTTREGPINNAALGYIHENGAPEVNIPARPFLIPGVKSVQTETVDGLRKATEFATDGRPDAVERQFHRVGLRAVSSVKSVIRSKIPPPLKPATVAARRRRSKGSKYRRKAVSPGDVTPLIDTGAMLNSITYVLRGNNG